MKKSTEYTFTAALALFTLCGCGNNAPEPDVNLRKNSPDFTASIGLEQSRAYNQTWEENDEIGISGANRSNVRHVTSNGNGTILVKNSGEQIYFQEDGETTFTAYYPWTDMAGSTTTINGDTKQQSEQKQKGMDFLWAQASGKKDSPIVNFIFSHRMAKLSITVKPGTGMSFDEVKAATLSLGGFCHTGSFNTTDGTAYADNGEKVSKWTFSGGISPVEYNETEKTATYSLLLFPQSFESPLELLAELDLPGNSTYHLRANIDFTAANREKDNSAAKNEWVASRQYNLSLTLNKTEIMLGECVISPWTSVSGDEIVVD